MSSRFALIIANTEYTDPGLAQLTAPGKDAKEFGRVLDSPEIGAFNDVIILFNENASKAKEMIDRFFSAKKPDDLLVLYFFGHGVRDEYGSLYLAVKNTSRDYLRSTAIESDFITKAMDQSRSKRQVLILDCCNSGAFAQGSKGATGVSIGTASSFEGGYGRVILTASDSTQFAWEGNKVIGESTDNSLFTHYLVEGLEGVADLDGDGRITVDELYDYAYEKVRLATPKQTPSKFSTRQQGEIVLRQNIPIKDVESVDPSGELLDEIDDTRANVHKAIEKNAPSIPKWSSVFWITFGWVIGILGGSITFIIFLLIVAGFMPSGFSEETLSQTPILYLPMWTSIFASLGTIFGWIIAITLRLENIIYKGVQRITLGWSVGFTLSGVIFGGIVLAMGGGDFVNGFVVAPSLAVALAIGGAIGGYVTARALHDENILFDQKGLLRVVLGWTIGLASTVATGGLIHYGIGLSICGGVGAAIGGAIMILEIRNARFRSSSRLRIST